MNLGIDFGTSFSQIAAIQYDRPLILMNPGEYGIPSAFYYDRENGILVGQNALDAGQGRAAANLVTNVKMAVLSGKSFTLDGRTFTAKEIISEIYKALIRKGIQNASRHFIDAKIESVVISVPAKFGMQERALIRDAARDCLGPGQQLPIVSIIKEPVAAAMMYYTAVPEGQHVLVYDLGGGTCDLALVRAEQGNAAEPFTVIDADMLRIGGRDWDERLIEHLVSVFEQKSGVAIRGHAGYEEKIRRAAISAKHALSDPGTDSTTVRVEINGDIYASKVNQALFEELTMDLLQQTVDCFEEMYDRYRGFGIREIICVGGSSNMRQVECKLRQTFPQCEIKLFEPEHAVVNGAALRSVRGVTDISNFSYGVACRAGHGRFNGKEIISNIIRCHSPLPADSTKNYYPREDNMDYIEFRVFESEIDDEEYLQTETAKRYVGTLKLELPAHTTTDTKLNCNVRLNESGMLEVRASEGSGREITASFRIQNL